MKIRTDFVTNSSSSSYVIAYKKAPEIDSETLTKYPFIKNYSTLLEKVLSANVGDKETLVFNTLAEYEEYFVFYYGDNKKTLDELLSDNGYNYAKPQYDKVKVLLDKGYSIILTEVDYDEEYYGDMVETLAKSSDMVVIVDID